MHGVLKWKNQTSLSNDVATLLEKHTETHISFYVARVSEILKSPGGLIDMGFAVFVVQVVRMLPR